MKADQKQKRAIKLPPYKAVAQYLTSKVGTKQRHYIIKAIWYVLRLSHSKNWNPVWMSAANWRGEEGVTLSKWEVNVFNGVCKTALKDWLDLLQAAVLTRCTTNQNRNCCGGLSTERSNQPTDVKLGEHSVLRRTKFYNRVVTWPLSASASACISERLSVTEPRPKTTSRRRTAIIWRA